MGKGGVLKRVWSRLIGNCKVEVRRIPGLNPMAILQEPKGLVRGVPACIGYDWLCLIELALLNKPIVV